ncbi:S-layer homology domain-containing protein [Saccharibacillus sp. O23]|uniref:S-layer homology domain-containing protein n=1 Tax=Saccharibacillus sp. O23 TaxID=2009338 RepID=UPI0015C58E27|nr:S-layer homology domain-containing protein [Saccharibacillus sp. O23]
MYIATKVQTLAENGTDLSDVAYDNGYIYAADKGLGRIVKVALDNPQNYEVVVTGLDDPESIAFDNRNHLLYIADTENHQVKMYNDNSKEVTVVAGTGIGSQEYDGVPAVQASLTEPMSVAVDKLNGTVYVADLGRIQKLTNQFFYKQTRDDDGKVWNLVENAEGLDRMRDDLEANYRLDKNISASELQSYLNSQHQIERTPSEASWTPIGENDETRFEGRFDGGGHTIEGLQVLPYDASNNIGGLFGYVYGADIRNVRLTGVNYSVFESAGGLATSVRNSTIEKVSVEGTVRGYGQNVGGFAGELIDTSVKESYFNGKVEGRNQLGGFAGMVIIYDPSNVRTIENSYAWSEITDRSYDNRLRRSSIVGGFVGYVSYEGLDNGSTNSLIPTIFKNTYASTEFKTNAPALDVSSDIITGWPFEGIITEGQPPYKGISSYWDSTFPTREESYVASKLTTEQMKKQDSFVGWDFNNVWTLQTNDAKRAGYPTLKAFAAAPTTPTTPTTPSNPSTGGGTSTPVVNTPAPTNTTTINVNVQNNTATNGAVVASLAITRTKGTDGTVKDQLQLTPTKAKEIIDLLKTSGSKTAAIVLPDTNDEVSEWNVGVPKDASSVLTGEGVELVILNPNVRISVPASSLNGLTDDLYFRLIPVKSTATSTEIQQRALGNAEIVKTANGGDITVVGRPMTIETNLQSRPVTLTLPLPANSTFTAAQQQKLGVYIEHSDGTKQLVRGKVVTLEDGKLGLEISVNHFSTFTIVNVSKWGGTLNAAPYIMGYADGSFKPAQDITRAELAAIVSRITGVTEGTASFSDVKNGSWASTVVGPAAASGIMTGYSDGTFKPNASITRGELAAALAKLLPQSGLSKATSAAGFGDLSGHWAASAAAELQAAGVVTGYADGSFKPEQAVTRAEAVTMINRLIGLDASMTVPGASEWSDVASGYWAHDAIRAASMARN